MMLYFYRNLRVSTNLRRFENQELSPNVDVAPQQPDWAGHLKRSSDDYELAGNRAYPDSFGDQGYDRVQSGYVVEGYPEGVVMRKRPDDRPYYQYQSQHYGERDGNAPLPSPAAAASADALVSGRPQDLYAKVVKPSARDQNVIPRQPYDVDPGRPNFDGSASSTASFALRPDVRGPSATQRDLPPSRDVNHNISKAPSSVDGPSRSQPRVHRAGDRHIDGTPMFGDPSKDGSRRPATSANDRPNHLPLPASVRGNYIDEIAAGKTPHTQQDLMQAKALSQQRYGQPSFFQYPEGDATRQVSSALLLLMLFLQCVLWFAGNTMGS